MVSLLIAFLPLLTAVIFIVIAWWMSGRAFLGLGWFPLELLCLQNSSCRGFLLLHTKRYSSKYEAVCISGGAQLWDQPSRKGKGRESSSTDPQGTMCPSSKAGCLQFGNSWLLCCQILLCNCLVLLISNTLFEVLCLKSPLNERIAFTALIVVVCCIPLSSVYVVFSPWNSTRSKYAFCCSFLQNYYLSSTLLEPS